MTVKHHPEQLSDEIYMGNTKATDVLRSSWRTSRLGTDALMRDGQPIPYNETMPVTLQLRPWFIKVAEVQQVIDAELAAGNKDRAQKLQPLVDNRTWHLG